MANASRSILPAIIVHVLHNSISVLAGFPGFKEAMEVLLMISSKEEEVASHLPIHVVAMGLVLLVAGILLCRKAEPCKEGEGICEGLELGALEAS